MEGVDDILPEKIDVGIRIAADILAAGTEMDDGRRRNGYLGGARGCSAKKFEIVDVDRSVPSHPRLHARNQQGQLMAFAVDEINFVDRRWVVGDRASTESAKIKIGIENLAAIFAVGDRLEPDALLERDRVANRRVFDGAQLLGGDFAARAIAAGLQQFRWPQQAADVVGSERRIVR